MQENQNFNLFVDIVLSHRQNNLIVANGTTDVFVNALVLRNVVDHAGLTQSEYCSDYADF